MKPYEISQWTKAVNNQVLYDRLAQGSDPDMRGADGIKFNPHEMIARAAVSQVHSDLSYQRFEQLQIKPVYVYVGGFILFLVVMKYLTSPK
jgi:hypothetical protein